MKDSKKNKYFSISSLHEDKSKVYPEVKSVYLNKHLERVENLNQLVRIPQEGEVFFLQTEKAFNAFTFIPWIAKLHFIEELYASTYSISRRVVEALQELQQNGRVGKVTLLISDSMPKRNPLTIDVLEGVCKHNGNFNVKYFWNHSKICLLKVDGFHLVLEGSGNWSENAQLEQYVLANSKEVFEFRKTIFE
ncbi:hypothetical protein [Riemerella anatipestifer]|uniref:Phospholipase D-like domain-containing protein n=1 Tax=Riemerella anatipestifer RA-CH-1 TaxID=1228997 RepID=J9QTG6_RIEAN|nr:hypothetical protein [Riemerella anatipestifer]AFR35886.1 hypothetical protein B739_1288 [Riemerella anatipestifer RA-CH-1]MCU7581603.1 hypothetical protein [Riemerella anatipestifer]MDD1550121.1 hypothetical protein [Riemerella anatipestifer]MSN87440.1 hypothetical protein [Riemerella anatipestifer]MSN91602.1 hypothetical protein [Riemerella anatipestifer]